MIYSDKWDKRFLELAKHVSTWSKDPSTQVGAVLVQNRNEVVGIGYNGFPRGVGDLEERYADRAIKYEMVVHAEVNAILMAKDKAQGASLYVYPSFSLPPICANCCKTAIQAGVIRVVGYFPNMDDDRVKRWAETIKISEQMCNEVGIDYYGILPD